MEILASFFGETDITVLLIPAVLVLVIALIVVNKHKKVEIVTPEPVPPVTTVPTPPAPSEVVQQAITQPVQPVQPVQAAAVASAITPPVSQEMNTQTVAAPLVADQVPVPVSEPVAQVAQVVAEEHPVLTEVQPAVINSAETMATPVAPTWRPDPQVAIVEEKPVVEESVQEVQPQAQGVVPASA